MKNCPGCLGPGAGIRQHHEDIFQTPSLSDHWRYTTAHDPKVCRDGLSFFHLLHHLHLSAVSKNPLSSADEYIFFLWWAGIKEWDANALMQQPVSQAAKRVVKASYSGRSTESNTTAEQGFLHRVSGLSIRDKESSSAITEGLRMELGCLPGPSDRSYFGHWDEALVRPRNSFRGYISWLAGNASSSPLEELEEAEDMEVWGSSFSLFTLKKYTFSFTQTGIH